MLKTFKKLRQISNIHLLRHICKYSTQPAVKETTEQEDQLKEFQRISNIQRKLKEKKPKKPPFVKNLLLGVFDTDLLTYPELSNEQLNLLNKNVQEVETFLRNSEIKECKEVSKQFLNKMASGRLLGLQTSQLMNGRELSATEFSRFLEIISEFNLKNALISNEVLGVQTLLKFGSEHLQRKYLQKLIDGNSISAFCVVEQLPSNADVFKKSVTKSADGKTWILNGRKTFVTNGSDADLYIVVACSNYVIKDNVREQKYTAFVVERDFGGITSSRKNKADGGQELSDVIFENTAIPSENVIGQEDSAENILTAIFPEYRLSTGPVCSVLLKNLINKTTEHFINISKEPNLLYETDAVRIKLGEFLSSLYAIDSMIYLTAGLIDNYENQDTELESAIVKVFASEQAFLSTSSCMDLIGADSIIEEHWCNQLHKEALCQTALNDNNDNLKILIALFGLRYAGKEMNELIKKIRNPLFYSTFALKRMWANRKQAEDRPKLDLYLYQYLHPSCALAAQRLEYCVLRLKFATEIFLSRYGPDIINRHADLRRLSECLIDIYAMVASLGRASRSYCIGLQHAEYEMTLASSFSTNATKRIKSKLEPIIEGPVVTTDENSRFTTERLYNFKTYYPVHPLTRNF